MSKQALDKVNRAFTSMSEGVREFRDVCRRQGSPIKSVTFRNFPDGTSKLHATYRKVAASVPKRHT